MTSLVRSHTLSKDKQLQYVRVTGPYYVDAVKGSTLFPLTYKDGILDIADIDSVSSYSGVPLMDVDVGLYNIFLYKMMGGDGLVTKLGANFVNYIKRWRSSVTTDPVTKVSLHIPGIVTKVQRARKDALYTGAVYRVSTAAQESDTYTDGSADDMYRATWIFKKPITIRTVEDGVTKYIVLNTTLY